MIDVIKLISTSRFMGAACSAERDASAAEMGGVWAQY
jgi:hypothetical protein